MAKYDAFGTALAMGIRQVETATVVGTISTAGNATFTLTKAGMTGSPIATSVAVLLGDSPETVATKAATALNLNANITAKCRVEANGANVIVTALEALANDATFNLAYTNGTCAGLTPDATSTDTTAGVALTPTAQVADIGGPGLSVDTEDVTTHDQASAFEEVIATILRSGEVTLEIVYDPVADSHDYAGGVGLLRRLNDKTLAFFELTFPDAASTKWSFPGYVTGFEPTAAVDGALSASVTIKITGTPTLA